MCLSLGAALYYNRDLALEGEPLRVLWHGLTRELSATTLFQWTGTVSRVGKKQPFDLKKLETAIAAGSAATAAIESDRGSLVLSHALASSQLSEPLVPRPWKYDTAITIASDDLEQIGKQRVVDSIVAFADAVAAKAGIIYWAESAAYASALALSGSLSPEQGRRVRESHDFSNHWGRIVRGPAWGTFLNATHVAALEMETLKPAKVVPLRSGGAFVQVTSVDDAVAVDAHSPPLDRLRAALASLLVP